MDTYDPKQEYSGGEPVNIPPQETAAPEAQQPEAYQQSETYQKSEAYHQSGETQRPETCRQTGAYQQSWQAGTYQQPGTYQQTYWGQSVRNQQSPFADSPYVMYGGYGNVPPAQPEPRKKSSGKGWRRVLAAVLVMILVAGGCGTTAVLVNQHWEKETEMMTAVFNQKIAALQEQLNEASSKNTSVSGNPVISNGESLEPSQVYARNVESVVAISNQGRTTNVYGQISETASSGSGFILTEDGYVVTNFHVVEGATTLTVITYDRKEYPAKLVGFDAANDLAVLKIDAKGLQPVTVGSSDALIVGDRVAAIGNPLGELTSTLTVGYVSAKDRVINTDGTLINMMQTDAAINPGNSGGPLFNMKGEVVGITTAKFSGTTASGASIEGIGFAIPIDDVIGMIDDIRQYGYVTGAYLGVMVRSMDEGTAKLYGLPVGAYVESVTSGGSADSAGVQAKDIIVNLGGYDIANINDLTRALRKFQAGETAIVTVFRAGKEVNLTITFDEKPHETVQDPVPAP